jgi:hypothetical protein
LGPFNFICWGPLSSPFLWPIQVLQVGPHFLMAYLNALWLCHGLMIKKKEKGTKWALNKSAISFSPLGPMATSIADGHFYGSSTTVRRLDSVHQNSEDGPHQFWKHNRVTAVVSWDGPQGEGLQDFIVLSYLHVPCNSACGHMFQMSTYCWLKYVFNGPDFIW